MTRIEVTKDNKRWKKGAIVLVRNDIAQCLVRANVAKIIAIEGPNEGLWVK